MFKPIDYPHSDNREIYSVISNIKQAGYKIECFYNDEITGRARNKIFWNELGCRVDFKDTDFYTALHELLHLDLIIVKKYPRIIFNDDLEWVDGLALCSIADMFEHKMIEPGIAKAGYSLKRSQGIATTKNIDKLKSKALTPQKITEGFINPEFLFSVVCIEAQIYEVSREDFNFLTRYKFSESNWHENNKDKIESFIKNLPRPKVEIKEYINCIKRCLKIIGLEDCYELKFG